MCVLQQCLLIFRKKSKKAGGKTKEQKDSVHLRAHACFPWLEYISQSFYHIGDDF